MPDEPQFLPIATKHAKGVMPDGISYDVWCNFETSQALFVQEVDNKPVSWEIVPLGNDDLAKEEDKKRFATIHFTILNDEPQRYTQEYLPSSGGIPGYPGTHGAGAYVLDTVERTVYTLAEWEAMQVKPVVEKPAKGARASKDMV